MTSKTARNYKNYISEREKRLDSVSLSTSKCVSASTSHGQSRNVLIARKDCFSQELEGLQFRDLEDGKPRWKKFASTEKSCNYSQNCEPVHCSFVMIHRIFQCLLGRVLKSPEMMMNHDFFVIISSCRKRRVVQQTENRKIQTCYHSTQSGNEKDFSLWL